jgi:DNA-binding CsgD family transcriptional regulator
MRNNAAQTQKRLASSSRVPNPTIEELLRILVDRVAISIGCASGRGLKDEAEEIIMDVEVDGSRYLLVRLPKPTRARVSLSPREQEIVRMVAQGHPNRVIADVLNISSWTVCTHLRRIFGKLQVGSRAAMVARHLELGRGGLKPGCAELRSGVSPASTAGPAEQTSNSSAHPVCPSSRIPGRIMQKGTGIRPGPLGKDHL